jgi:beta-lactamase class A
VTAFLLAIWLCADPATQIARDAGRVGVEAVVLEGVLEGKEVLAFHSREQFPMQSVYKLPIAMAAMAQVDASRLKLDQIIHVPPSEYVPAGLHSPLRDAHPGGADVPLSEILRLAVSESDGTASDVLLRLIGGPPAAMEYLHRIGVTGMMIRDSEMNMSRAWAIQYANYATPESAVALLRALQESHSLSNSSRDLLLKFMTETTTFPTRIKGLLPPGTVVAHKTGSSGTENGVSAATNDIGIVTLPDGRHLAVAVFVSDSRASDSNRDLVIAKMAQLAWTRAQP